MVIFKGQFAIIILILILMRLPKWLKDENGKNWILVYMFLITEVMLVFEWLIYEPHYTPMDAVMGGFDFRNDRNSWLSREGIVIMFLLFIIPLIIGTITNVIRNREGVTEKYKNLLMKINLVTSIIFAIGAAVVWSIM